MKQTLEEVTKLRNPFSGTYKSVKKFLKEDYDRTYKDFLEVKEQGVKRITQSKSAKNLQNLLVSSIPGAMGGGIGSKVAAHLTNNTAIIIGSSISSGVAVNYASLGILSKLRGVTENLKDTLKHLGKTFVSAIPLTGTYILSKGYVQNELMQYGYSPVEASLISDVVIISINSAILTYCTHGYHGKRKTAHTKV